MDSKVLLQEYKERVDVYLERYFNEKIEQYGKISSESQGLVESLKEFTLRGGKRVRPALLYYTYKMLGGKDDEECMKISMAIELVESFLLIHDDIFDHAPLRRGKKTVHKLYEESPFGKNLSDSKHYGRVMSILCGDLGILLVYDIISSSKFSDDRKARMASIVSDKTSEVLFGQIHDFILPLSSDFTEEDIIKIDTYKTASYTCILPVLCGAVLAGAPQDTMAILKDFSLKVGIAFQLRDDVLGLFGEESKLGKDISSDLREGKKTLLILKAIQNGTDEQVKFINSCLGNADISVEDVVKVRDIVKETGSLEYSKNKCKYYIDQAQEALDKLDDNKNEGWDFLKSIAEYIVLRDY